MGGGDVGLKETLTKISSEDDESQRTGYTLADLCPRPILMKFI